MGFKDTLFRWIGIEETSVEEDGFLPEQEEAISPRRGAAPRVETQVPRRQAQAPLSQERQASGTSSKATVMMHPMSFTDAQVIVDNLIAQRTVIVNVEELSTPDAQRVMDFLSGAVYAMDASLKLSSNSVFVLTPPHHLVINETEQSEETSPYEY